MRLLIVNWETKIMVVCSFIFQYNMDPLLDDTNVFI